MEALALHPPGEWLRDYIDRTGELPEIGALRLTTRLLNRCPPGLIVDGGAMVGTHSAYWASHTNHIVHAFEPVPVNYRLLRRNLRPDPRARVNRLALSDVPETVTIHVDAAHPGSSSIDGAKAGPGPLVTALAVRLDSLGLSDVRLIKLDLEGHEPQALAGARETIERWRPMILIEDWERIYAPLLPGYREVAGWPDLSTFLYVSASSE